MIRGYCIGGGLGLATCCDLRICTDNSRFAVPAAKLGLGYGYTGLKRLVDIVGPSFAKEIFYTARQFDAQEALAMGLVNRVVPAAELETYVKSITDMICANAPLTIKAVKVTVGEVLREESKRDLARAAELVEALLREPRLHRRPHRLHGKAQAGVHRHVRREFKRSLATGSLPTPAHFALGRVRPRANSRRHVLSTSARLAKLASVAAGGSTTAALDRA